MSKNNRCYRAQAARFRNWRLNRGMTQVEIAAELGVSGGMISYWESGAVRLPPRVISAMRCSPDRSDILTDFGRVFARLVSPAEVGRRRFRALAEAIRARAGDRAVDVARDLGVSTMTVYRHRRRARA